jgi:hypothetical protein
MDPTWSYEEDRIIDLTSTHLLRDLVHAAFME